MLIKAEHPSEEPCGSQEMLFAVEEEHEKSLVDWDARKTESGSDDDSMLEEFLSGRSTKAAASHTANAKIDLDDMDPEPPMHQEGKAELLSALERNANSPTKQELQMRSMLLEQQNKKRILMARQEQSHPYHPPTSSRTPMPAAKPRVSVDVFGCDSPPRQLSCQPPNIQEMNGWLQSPLSSEQMQLIQKQQIEAMYNRAAQYYPTEPTYQRNPDSGNDALQDYQMQLMLLEQQNKKRLLMARREQNSMSYPPPPPSAHPMSTNHLVAPTTASANSSVILEKTKCEDNQSHKEQHLCCICNKAFRRLKHGERHMRTHRPMSERCHVCPVPGCEKSFNRQDNLMEHYKIHLEGWSGSCLTQLTFEGLYGLIRKTKNPDERAMSIETLEKWRNSEHNKQRRDRFLNDSEPDPDSNSLTTDVEEKIEATIHQRQHEGPATASEDKGNHFDNSLGGPSNNPFRQPSFDPFSTFFSHPFNASSGDLFGGLSKDPFRGPSNDPFSGSSNGFVLPIREPITKDSVDLQQASLARQRSMLAQQHSLCMHQQLLAQQRAAQQQQILACQQAMQQQQALQTNMQAQRLAKMQAQATEQ